MSLRLWYRYCLVVIAELAMTAGPALVGSEPWIPPRDALESDTVIVAGASAASALSAAAARFQRPISVAPEDSAILEHPPAMSLIALDTAGCEALAVATGSWWRIENDGAIALTHQAKLEIRRPRLRSLPGFLPRDPSILTLVNRLMDPWLAIGSSVTCDPATSSWSARLADDGERELVRILDLLGKPRTTVPSWVRPPPPQTIAMFLPTAADWSTWAEAVARATGRNVGIHPLVISTLTKPPAGDPLVINLEQAQMKIRGSSGAITIDVIEDAVVVHLGPSWHHRHPALRRALAIIPTAPWGGDVAAGTLAEELSRAEPETWRQPGWVLAGLVGTPALLVVGDLPAIHGLLDVTREREIHGNERPAP